MGGAIYESFIDRFLETAGRLTGYIKGPCISYDTTTQKLLTTPHNTGCSNYADEFIIFSAVLLILLIPIAACVHKKPARTPRNPFVDSVRTLRRPAEEYNTGIL